MKYMILAAHPDDEVLGCGATAARLSKEGHEVLPIILCENASVRYDGERMKKEIEEFSRKSSNILGIEKPVFLGLPDQKLDKYSALEMARIIEDVIRKYEPETIFTHHGGDINKDHQIVFEATLVATRPVPNCKVKNVYSYETISSTEWAYTEFYSNFKPTLFFDVTTTLDLKINAFGQYIPEVKDYPHPCSLRSIEIRAKDWGSRVGLRAAEAFQIVRCLL